MGPSGVRASSWQEVFSQLGSPQSPLVPNLGGQRGDLGVPSSPAWRGRGFLCPTVSSCSRAQPRRVALPLFGQQRGVWPWFIPLWVFGDGFQHPRGDVGAGGEAQVEGIRTERVWLPPGLGMGPGCSGSLLPRPEAAVASSGTSSGTDLPRGLLVAWKPCLDLEIPKLQSSWRRGDFISCSDRRT